MDKENFFTHFFNGQPIELVLSSFIWGLVGLLGSIFIELIRSSHNIKSKGGFQFGYWIKDNFYRILFSFFLIAAGSAYGNTLINKLGDCGPIALGFMTDKIVEGLVKFKEKFNYNFTDSNNDAT